MEFIYFLWTMTGIAAILAAICYIKLRHEEHVDNDIAIQ